ncbi:lysine 5,6-aminomutase reactivase subunit KamB [Ideonella paludis]|uniref:DUF1611 domain-containing protein n=1 Tax=Ideonella paludis TaxID=1233411 RepID=A0ABS5DZ94_9BURK|nr:hypothetical protein [Ideonella paludis]MBQ0936467.1 hypothetical protein [Ideonella paludis]
MSEPRSPLWRHIVGSDVRTVAFMGMTKNTGKTVALNHVLAAAAQAGCTAGVTSIGRDGEDRDQVFQVPKPPVMVWPGSLVATARTTLQRAKVKTRYLGSTDISSPMGEILLVQVLEKGEMEIAGASRSADQHTAIALLQQCGADRVMLDGALGRSHHASPAIADGVVLATGAALGGGMGDVLRKTRDRLAILNLAAAPAEVQQRCAMVFEDGGVGLWGPAGEAVFQAPIATLNAGTTLLAQAQGRAVALVAVSGAVGRALWAALLSLAQANPGLTVMVADGTKLFVEASDLAQLQRLGAQLLAHRAIRLMGLTVNPFSPYGGSFQADDFLATAQHAFPGLCVSDVLLEFDGVSA